jgi:5,10-methylenetetrahydromethanopterin reductase
LEIGCIFAPSIDTPEHIAIAESLGYRYGFVADSPTFFADAWMTLARAAERTSSITLGVSVITPRMRHLVANAGAVATLHTLAPGRVEMVVGAGFTSQAMIGKKPARWVEVEAYVVALRALLRGEEVEWDDAVVGLPYGERSGIELPADVPIWVAAHGPKGFAVGERVADGIVTNPGHGSQNTVWPHDRVFLQFNGTVLDDGEALDSARVIDAAGPAAALHLHIGAEGAAGASDEVAGYTAALAQVDERRRHIEMHRGHLIEVTEMERPYITAELIGAATGTGSPDAVAASLRELEASGASGVLYMPNGADIGRELRTFAAAAGL